jgi:hypothetical protein
MEGGHFSSPDPSGYTLYNIQQEFDFIIKAYCHKNRFGDSHVRRDDYEVIRADDNQIIDPSELASTVEPGMVLEISIFLRRSTAFWDDRGNVSGAAIST